MHRRAHLAAVCDGLLAAIALLAVSNLLFGGVRLFSDSFRLSINSLTRLLIVGAIVVAVRYFAAPEPSLAARAAAMAAAVKAWARTRAVRTAAPAWLGLRIGVLLVGFFAIAAIGPPGPRPPLRSLGNPLLDQALRWDTGWYLQLAADGYEWDSDAVHRQQNIAFFPAYPFLMHVGGALLGARPDWPIRNPARDERYWGRTLAAGWLLSLAAAFASMCAMYNWAARTAGPAVAERAVWLLAAYPFALFFSAAYTESLFLLAAIAAFNAVASGRAGHAAFWGLFAALLRPNGVVLCVPLAILVAGSPKPTLRMWASAAMPCVGLALFCAYIWSLSGNPLAWMSAHAAWGRTPLTWDGSVAPALTALRVDGLMAYATANPVTVLNAAALLFTCALLPIVWRRLGAAPAVLVIVSLVPPLMAGGLMSIGRLTATMFPSFVALALILPRRHVPAWIAAFALLQGLAAAIFFSWRPLV